MEDVYTRILVKCKEENFSLDAEERERLEDMIIDTIAEMVTRLDDEEIMNYAKEGGII